MKIDFFEPCIPPTTTHHSKKIVNFGGFTRLADTEKLVTAKSFWDTLFLAHRPIRPLDGPLRLYVSLTWQWNGSDNKKRRAAGWVWHDTQPDTSNMTKTIVDAAVRCGYMKNDSRIVIDTCEKRRGDRNGIQFLLEELNQPWEQPEI